MIKRITLSLFLFTQPIHSICAKQATTNSANEASRAQIFTRVAAQRQCRDTRSRKKGVRHHRGARYRRDDQNDRKVVSEPAKSVEAGRDKASIARAQGRNRKQSESH